MSVRESVGREKSIVAPAAVVAPTAVIVFSLVVTVTALVVPPSVAWLWIGMAGWLVAALYATVRLIGVATREPSEDVRVLIGLAGATAASWGAVVGDPGLPVSFAASGSDAAGVVPPALGLAVAVTAVCLALPFALPARTRCTATAVVVAVSAGMGTGLGASLLRGARLDSPEMLTWTIGGLLLAAMLLCGVVAWVSQAARVRGDDSVLPSIGLIGAAVCAGGLGAGLLMGRHGAPLTVWLLPVALWAVGGGRRRVPLVARRGEPGQGEQALAISEERRRATQLQILNRLALVLNSEEDTGRVLDQVLRGATQLLGAHAGSLYLFHDGRLQLEAFSMVKGVEAGHEPGSSVQARSLALQAAAEKRVIRLASVSEAGRSEAGPMLAAPLIRGGGDVLGCLVTTGSQAAAGFSAADEMMAVTLAAHITVALQNRQRLEQEQQVAEYLQRAMLPHTMPAAGLELDITYESATEAALVGGDFYDVIPLGSSRTCLAVGDVCGKGLTAATEMAMVRHTIRAFASLGLEAGRWLTLCNEAAVADGEAADYITVALVVADTSTRTLDYAIAGHPPPIVALPDTSWELAGCPGLPIGSWRRQKYETHRVVLPKGASLVLYTDGLYEARLEGGPLFGEAGLSEAVRSLAAGPLPGAAARLVAAARAHAGGRLADDVVVVAVRIPPPGSALND